MFYEKGPPSLANHLPLWLASYLDRAWLMLVTLIAITIPLFKIFPRYRKFQSGLLITGAYEELRVIDRMLETAVSQDELRDLINQLKDLEAEISGSWIASDNLDAFYGLKKAVELVWHQASTKLNTLPPTADQKPEPKT